MNKTKTFINLMVVWYFTMCIYFQSQVFSTFFLLFKTKYASFSASALVGTLEKLYATIRSKRHLLTVFLSKKMF